VGSLTIAAQKLRCREISETDIDAVAGLLTRGFVSRSREYWVRGLRRQAAREIPNGYPRFGYMLDCDGLPVGVLLLLYTARADGAETTEILAGYYYRGLAVGQPNVLTADQMDKVFAKYRRKPADASTVT